MFKCPFVYEQYVSRQPAKKQELIYEMEIKLKIHF